MNPDTRQIILTKELEELYKLNPKTPNVGPTMGVGAKELEILKQNAPEAFNEFLHINSTGGDVDIFEPLPKEHEKEARGMLNSTPEGQKTFIPEGSKTPLQRYANKRRSKRRQQKQSRKNNR